MCLSFMKNLLKGTKYYINRAIGIAIKCMYITFRIRYEQSLLGRSTVKFQDIRKIASKRGLKVAMLNKLQLIRNIQKDEGNYKCFATPYVHECGQMNCLWREDCLNAL